MLSATANRVEEHTLEKINNKIRHNTQRNVAKVSQGGRVTINERLIELDKEWDTERLLQANFAIISLIGLAFSRMNSKWLYLTIGAAGFMAQHALQGWCPPLGLFRRLGVRTYKEIEEERFELMNRRGDFNKERRIK